MEKARSADAVFTSVPSTYFYEIKSGVKLNENTSRQEVSQRHSGVKAEMPSYKHVAQSVAFWSAF